MSTLGEINGQIPEMRPILRYHKAADTEPHSPQSPAHAKNNEQQTRSDKRTTDRLQIVKESMRTVASAQIHFVESEAVIEDQQSRKNKNDQAPEQ